MLEAIKTEHGNLDITIGGEICGEAKTKEFRVETADLGTPIPYEEICKSKAFYSRHDWAEVEKLYKNGGYTDAPSEVIERYRRVKSLRRRLEKRAFYKEAAEKMGLRSYHEARELARACTNEEFEKIVRLLSTKKFRSSFRQSLASQVRAWVDGKSEFATPLSPRQFAALY